MAILLAVLSAVLAGVAAFSALRHVRHWASPEFWIAPAVALWPFLVLVVASVVPRLSEILDDEDLGFAVTVAPLVLTVMWVVVVALRLSEPRIGLAAGAVALIALIAAVGAAALGQSWLHGVIAALILLGCALVRGDTRSAIDDGVLVSVVAMIGLIGAYAALLPQFAMRTDCDDNGAKCELLGGFISIGDHSASNAFAITLAMLGGFAVFRLRAWAAVVMTVAVGSAAIASGARLATACAVAVCIVALATKLPRIGGVAAVAAAATALVASLTPAVFPFPDHLLTDRGSLWARARDMVLDAPIFGHGLSFWVRDAQTQANSPRSYSPHNMWLDLAVAVGIVGTVAVAIAVLCGVLLASPAARLPALVLVVGVLIGGSFESTFMPFRINPIPAGMIVLLAYLSASQRVRLPWRADEPSLTARPASRPARRSA